MPHMKCNIYRCSLKDEMYLYVHADIQLDDLPEELLKLVKQLSHVMELELGAQRKLARADVKDVMNELEEKGYFLQMPPNGLQPELYSGD